MNSVIEQLAEIEATAQAIVEHAQEQKGQIEKELQEKRDAYDRMLQEKTQEQIEQIRQENEEKMETALSEQREKNHSAIEGLEKEFEENHTAYAEAVLKNIIEV